MAGEQDDQDDLEVTHQDDAQGDADFEAAFNRAQGFEPHAEGLTDTNDAAPALELDAGQPDPDGDDDDNDDQPAAPAAAAPVDDDNAPVTVSRKDFARLMGMAESVTTLQEELRTTKDKTFGKLGSLQQMVDGFKAQAKAGPAFSGAQLKRLSEEYPEMAAVLQQDLADAFGAQAATPPADDANPVDDDASGAPAPGADAPHDPFADPRVQELMQQQEAQQRQLHQAVVDKTHPGWLDMAKTPEFAEWKNSLPAQAQQLLQTSWDSSVLCDALNDYKAWSEKRNASASASNQRGKRLEHAVPATTGRATGAHVDDPDAAFNAGFDKVRGG